MHSLNNLKSGVHRRNTILATGCFYVGILLFVMPDYRNIGVSIYERGNVYLFGAIPFWLVSLVVLVLSAFLTDRKHLAITISKRGIIFAAFFSFYVLLGIIQGNDIISLRTDIMMWLWILGGISIVILILQTKYRFFHLLMFNIIMTFMLHSATISAALDIPDNLTNMMRISDSLLYYYSNILMIPTSLLIILGNRKHAIFKIIIILIIATHVYDGAIRSATRSIALTLTLMVFLSLFSAVLSKRLALNNVIKKAFILRYSIVLIIVLFLIIMLFIRGVFGESILFLRIYSAESHNSILLRLLEVEDAITQMGATKVILGGGIGFHFLSILGYDSLGLHIGIITFLLKFGAIPFSFIVYFLLFRIPLYYLKAIFGFLSYDKKLRYAILVVSPGFLAWISLLCMSGGYSSYDFLGVGMGIAAFVEIRSRGFSAFDNQRTKRKRALQNPNDEG
jgi:hypothetical protein